MTERVMIIVLLTWAMGVAWADHGTEQSPCTDIPRMTKELAHLDSIPPEVPPVPEVTQEEHDRLTARWQARREVYRAHLMELQSRCGVSP